MAETIEDLIQLLRMYHIYLRMLSIEHLPRLVDRFAGDLGFGPLARLYAETTRSYIEQALQLPKEERTPGKLIQMMKDVMSKASQYLSEPLFNFTYRVNGEEITIEVPEKPRTRLDKLRAAPVLGILAGVYEASGYQALIITDNTKHVPPPGEKPRVVITLEDCGSHACIIARRG